MAWNVFTCTDTLLVDAVGWGGEVGVEGGDPELTNELERKPRQKVDSRTRVARILLDIILRLFCHLDILLYWAVGKDFSRTLVSLIGKIIRVFISNEFFPSNIPYTLLSRYFRKK